MRESVDTLLVINNERLREISGNLTLGNAFAQADDVLTTAAKGIAEVISVTGAINVDFNDVNTVMKDSGVAIMGSAHAEGENRAIKAVQEALTSPLLNDNDISGAKYVLLNITYGSQEVLMDEISDITDYIQDEAGSTADVIWGHGYDETLGDALSVTLIATGFNQSPVTGFEKAPERKVQVLEDDNKKEITEPLSKATAENTYSEAKNEEKEEEPYIKSEVQEEQENNSNSFNWEVTTASESDNNETERSSEETESSKEVKRYYLEDDMEERTEFQSPSSKQLTPEEQQRRAQERMDRIQQFASHLKSAEGLNELEKEPAFKRRKINLEDEPHSSEDNISRYEVSEDDENKTTLRGTNSFLHDNVD
jgi:cell division protein FtsZ